MMLREQSHFIYQAHKLFDIVLTVASYVSAFYVKLYFLPNPLRGLIPSNSYFTVLLLVIIIWSIAFTYFKLYHSFRTQPLQQILYKLFKSLIVGLIVLVFIMYLLKISDVSRLLILLFIFINFIFLATSKTIIYRTLHHYRKKGYNLQNILIVGSRDRTRKVIDSIHTHASSGYRIIGCIGIDECEIGEPIKSGVSYIGSIQQLEFIFIRHVVDQVIFALPLDMVKSIGNHIGLAKKLGISVRFIPDWTFPPISNHPGNVRLQVENFLGMPTLCLRSASIGKGELQIKYVLDFVVASLLILVLFPLLFLIGLSIKSFSKGPILFTQERCGLNGRLFSVYKFRTMVDGAEKRQYSLIHFNESDGPAFKIKKDPRIIPFIGTFLRKTGLDELPQLLNVIKGEMSLVGPRPPIPKEVEAYDLWQRRRLSMKPGITCLWQCAKHRNDISFKEWMSLDLNYIDTWSLKLDLKILVKTALVVFTAQGR